MKIEYWKDAVTKISKLEEIIELLQLTQQQADSLQALSALERPGLYASITKDRKGDAIGIDIHCNSSRKIGQVWLICDGIIDWEAALRVMKNEKIQELDKVSSRLRDLSDMLKSLNQ